MQGVVLAGGLGTRLRPMTERMPKCMAQIGGKPFLFHVLSLLRQRGVHDIVVCIGYLGEQISDYFGDGREFGVNILYSQEREGLLGTGGALRLAEGLLGEEFLVINGDTYLDIDYELVYQELAASKKRAVIVASRSIRGERSDLQIDDRLVVMRYDKESNGFLGFVNAGVLALKRDVISGLPPGRPISLENDIFPGLIARGDMVAHVTEDVFYDIGTFDSLLTFQTRQPGAKR
jgi:mannose-1-phosphate guanylyltransferase